ncbi:MAG TPA: acetyl-CoA carboxylase biotin carboxyl carrier protein subunit, partial [Solirubrobacteraceae bacterium]
RRLLSPTDTNGDPTCSLRGRRVPRRSPLEVIGVAEVEAHITGTVWKIECAVGDQIEEGDTVAILESMKMEMPVEAEDAGKVVEILCEEGQAVNEGDTLVVLE